MNMPLSFVQIRDSRTAAAVAAALLLVATPAPALAGTTTASTSPSTDRSSDPSTDRPSRSSSKSESAGVASGFAVGAAAGGPVGAIVGAAAGGWLGDRLHREKAAHARTRDELAGVWRRGNGLSMHVMFRTDDARLRAEDEAMVARFATLAATTPGALVQVAGFADPRGSARHNAALAADRAAQVATRLVAAGLPSDRIVVSSETADPLPVATTDDGSPAVVGPPDLDGFAFQRRVTLTIATASAGEARVAQRR